MNLMRSREEWERLDAEISALRVDAERYRHFRENPELARSERSQGYEWRYREDLDAAIDAAIAAGKP